MADSFLDERRAIIPALDAQEELIARLLTRGDRTIDRFLDLGAGAGAFAEIVMAVHPRSSGVLVDFSEPMIAAADQRLAAQRGRWAYRRADLSSPGWRDALPAGERYDAVVSAFCIHHLPDARKRELYGEVLELLEPGGLFLNWEHVAAPGLAEGMLGEVMLERLVAAEQRRPDPRPAAEIERDFVEREAADGDILLDPETQRRWLAEIGFEQVDTFFKLHELSIFGGVKPWNQ
jgi:ubiquinone/menaquinone biosynthesis C-methylase UbiE